MQITDGKMIQTTCIVKKILPLSMVNINRDG